MMNLQRLVKLNELNGENPGPIDAFLLGVVIGKVEIRTFESNKIDRIQRSVLNFTFRDSVKEFVNVAFWLPTKDLIIINNKFSTGDVVTITNPVVKRKTTNFSPWSPVNFDLSMNEKSSIDKFEGPKAKQIEVLTSIPCRASNDFYKLSQIVTHGAELMKKTDGINVLAGVQQIGTLKTIRSKRQRETDYENDEKQLIEILLFDGETTGVCLTIWDAEQIKFAQRWISEEQILFCVSLRVRFDEYKKVYGLTATRQTLFTVNPDTNESAQLFESMRSIPIDDLLNVPIDGSFNTLQATIVTVEQLKEYLAKDVTNDSFIVQSFLSHFDLDGPIDQIVTRRCVFCNRSTRTECSEAECQMKIFEEPNSENFGTKEVFNLNVNLTDHTGTISNVKLNDDVARKMLKTSVDEFLLLTDEEKTKLKWNFLLEKFRFGIEMKNNKNSGKTIVRIVCLFPREYFRSSIDE